MYNRRVLNMIWIWLGWKSAYTMKHVSLLRVITSDQGNLLCSLATLRLGAKHAALLTDLIRGTCATPFQ